jgi:hypothetical protein
MAIDIPPVPFLRSLQDYVGAEDNHPSEIDLGTVEEAWKLSVLNVMKLALTIFRSTVFSSFLLVFCHEEMKTSTIYHRRR